jgi:hypothetical protein
LALPGTNIGQPFLELPKVEKSKMNSFMKRHLRRWMNLWPPFLGSGICVTRLDQDWRAIDVELRTHWWNRNYVGTHYGGSLYSMTDPFYMLMLIENLGRDYIVWDKSAVIRFRRPGRGTVTARFRLTPERLDDIREQMHKAEKLDCTLAVEVQDESGEVVAEVQKVVQVRRKSDRSTEETPGP